MFILTKLVKYFTIIVVKTHIVVKTRMFFTGNLKVALDNLFKYWILNKNKDN